MFLRLWKIKERSGGRPKGACFLFSGAAAAAFAVAAPNFHYTTSPAICQAKFTKKLHKNLSRNLCNLPIEKSVAL